MKGKSHGLKSNLKKIDNHKITEKEYDEINELPEEFFTEGQLYRDGKPVARRGRGAQKKPVKQRVSIRLDKAVVIFFKDQKEKGWQTELNEVLLDYVRKQQRKQKKRSA